MRSVMPISARLFLGFASNRLRRLETDLAQCVWELSLSGNLGPLPSAQLHLAQKAVASACAALLLLRRAFHQEAEGPQRSFLESWIFMMHFAWSPHDGSFEAWQSDPHAYWIARKFKIRQKVEAELPRRLGYEAPAYLPIQDLFRSLSNTSVHPTRDSAERAWRDAVARNGLDPFGKLRNDWEIARFNRFVFSLVTYLFQLHSFLKFLRIEILSGESIPAQFRSVRPSILESFLEAFLRKFVSGFKDIIQRAAEELARQPPIPESDKE